MRFDGVLGKAESNLATHGVSFDEAQTAFADPLFLIFADPDHSVGERRFIIMGESSKGRLQVVAYTERNEVVRLISARPTTRKERKFYEEEI